MALNGQRPPTERCGRWSPAAGQCSQRGGSRRSGAGQTASPPVWSRERARSPEVSVVPSGRTGGRVESRSEVGSPSREVEGWPLQVELVPERILPDPDRRRRSSRSETGGSSSAGTSSGWPTRARGSAEETHTRVSTCTKRLRLAALGTRWRVQPCFRGEAVALRGSPLRARSWTPLQNEKIV